MRTPLVTLALLSLAVPIGRAGAQEQAQEARNAAAGVQSRMIDEWGYVPVTLIEGPFVTSYASSTTALGNYTVDLELALPPALLPRTKGLTYLSFLQRFDLQLAFLKRFAVRFSGQGEAIVPDNGTSAFSLVLDGNWQVGGGLVAQLLSTDRLMLSAFADYRHGQRTVLSPASAIQQTAATRTFGDFFTHLNTEDVFAGGSFAYRFTHWIGGVAEANWEGIWPERSGLLFANQPSSFHFIDLSAAISANAWQQRFPVGATVFWRERIPVGGDNPFVYNRQFGGGLFYTGRPYLDVGIELFDDIAEQSSGNALRKVSRLYLAPRIRGYF